LLPALYSLDFSGVGYLRCAGEYGMYPFKSGDQKDEELLANKNRFALVVLTAKTALSGNGIKNSLERDELLLI